MVSLLSVEQLVYYREILLHIYQEEGKGVFYLSYFNIWEQFWCSQLRLDVYGEETSDFVSNLLCFSCFLNKIFQAAMLHWLLKNDNFLEKSVEMEEKYYFMNSSDGIPSKWHIIQHSTKFGKVLKYFYHFIVDLESNSEFLKKIR